jgi:hypothetical protein
MELVRQLDSARSGDQKGRLSRFFAEWNRSFPARASGAIVQSDTIKAIYAVFERFYQPLDLLKLGKWEWGNKLNKDASYVVVQNSVSYAVAATDSLSPGDNYDDPKPKWETIVDFRPPVEIEISRVLYMMPEYDSALNLFLGTQATRVGAGDIMNPSFPEGESEKRYLLLRPWLPILHGHWGGYWHLETHPFVSQILFNRQINRALVEFRVGYQGGEGLLVREAGIWKIKESHATWIE